MPTEEQPVVVQVSRLARSPQVPAPVHVQRVVLLRAHEPELIAEKVPPLVLSNRIEATPEVPTSNIDWVQIKLVFGLVLV